MTKENVLSLIVTLGALAAGVIALMWPTEAGTWAALITNTIVPAICAIIAAVWPVSAGVSKVYQARAMANAVRRLPRASEGNDSVEAIYDGIYSGLETNKIAYKVTGDNGEVSIDPVPVAPNVSRILANIWNSVDYSMTLKLNLLNAALETCSKAFDKIVNDPRHPEKGIKVPTTYKEVADYNAFWRNNQPSCAVNSEALFRQVLMPLRTVLKIKDTGDI